MYKVCPPSVPIFRACEVNGIATLSFAHEDTIPHHDGVRTLQDMALVSIRVHLCDPWDIMAFAALEDKECYSHTQCQDESR